MKRSVIHRANSYLELCSMLAWRKYQGQLFAERLRKWREKTHHAAKVAFLAIYFCLAFLFLVGVLMW